MNRKKDKEGNLIGTYNPDPILNTIVMMLCFQMVQSQNMLLTL